MAKRIKINIFDDMREALRDTAAYERGEAVNLRVTRIPARPKPISAKEVRRIRRPGTLRYLSQCESECGEELVAGHAPSTPGNAQTLGDRKEKPESAVGRLRAAEAAQAPFDCECLKFSQLDVE